MKKVISLSPTRSKFGPLLFSGNLNFGLKKASELGYDGVEISIRDSNEIDFSGLQARLKALDLKVYGISTGQTYYNDGFSLFSNDTKKRAKAVKRMKNHIDLAVELGAMVIIGGIRGRLEGERDNSKQLELGKAAVHEVCCYGAKKEVNLLLEPINRYETNIINTLFQGIELIKDLQLQNIKILADTFHMNIEEISYQQAFEETREYLGYIHFSDSNRLAPGLGHIDFKTIITTLIKIGYEGPIGIEVLPKPTDFIAAKGAIEFLNNLF